MQMELCAEAYTALSGRGATLWLWMASDLSWHSRQKTLQICLQLYPLTFNQRIHRPTKTLLLPETWVSLHLCSADRATMWETHLAWGKFIIQQHFAMEIRRFTLILVTEVDWRHNSWAALAKGQPEYGKVAVKWSYPVLLMLRHAA